VNEHLLNAYRQNWESVYDWAGHQVRRFISHRHEPLKTSILDVGAGQGKYRILFADYPRVDAIEIFEPYVEQNLLHELYDTVYIGDAKYIITQFPDGTHWDVVILGDVLEHLDLADAKQLLIGLERLCTEYFVVVPYEYAQGEEDGNIHQCHLQDDLTPTLMSRHYPQLELLAIESRPDGSPFKGLYKRRTNS
jgi:SAM-dependent methyltransferase